MWRDFKVAPKIPPQYFAQKMPFFDSFLSFMCKNNYTEGVLTALENATALHHYFIRKLILKKNNETLLRFLDPSVLTVKTAFYEQAIRYYTSRN